MWCLERRGDGVRGGERDDCDGGWGWLSSGEAECGTAAAGEQPGADGEGDEDVAGGVKGGHAAGAEGVVAPGLDARHVDDGQVAEGDEQGVAAGGAAAGLTQGEHDDAEEEAVAGAGGEQIEGDADEVGGGSQRREHKDEAGGGAGEAGGGVGQAAVQPGRKDDGGEGTEHGEHTAEQAIEQEDAVLADAVVDDLFIRKRRYSAFFGTELAILLKGVKAETLVLIGGLTDVCVHYTFVDAHQSDFYTRVVEDCVMGSSHAAHAASLNAMEYLQTGARRTTAEVLAGFGAMVPEPAMA